MNHKTRHENRAQAATGAYAMDGRGDIDEQHVVNSGWHASFDRLLGQGYIFMAQIFDGGGMLFRGMPEGALQALCSKSFWHNHSDNPLCRLERELDIVFCSETVRDALAVARPWQSDARDSAILVFSSAAFNRRWQQRAAAVLAFADVGMVFKYPCLAEPLALNDLYGVLLHPDQLAQYQTLEPVLPDRGPPYIMAPSLDELGSREGWAAALERLLAREGVGAAAIRPAADYPRR